MIEKKVFIDTWQQEPSSIKVKEFNINIIQCSKTATND